MPQLLRISLLFVMAALPSFALAPFNISCQKGAQTVTTSSIPSTTKVQQSFAGATVSVFIHGGAVGVVSTSGTAVTWVSGTQFNANSDWNGISITINAVSYTISTVTDTTHLTLGSSAGTQTSVAYVIATAKAPIFSDYLGSTPQANPLTCSATAGFLVYSPNSIVDETFSGAGISVPFTLSAAGGVDPLSTTTGLITYNASIGTAAAQCTAAFNANQTLLVPQVMAALSSQTMPCAMQVLEGGMIQPASGQTVTISGSVAAANVQIFDYSLGGTVAITNPPSASPVQWWGAAGDNTVDNTAPIQNAVNTICGSAHPGRVMVSGGIFRVAGTIAWAGNNCTIEGDNWTGTEIRHNPSAPNTDMISFPGTISYQTGNGLFNLLLSSSSTTNTRNIISAANQGNFTVDHVRVQRSGAGTPTHLMTLTGMISSLIQNSVFQGPTSGTNDNVVVANALATATTVKFYADEFLNSSGAGLNLGNSSGASAADMGVFSSIIEGNVIGLRASTGIKLVDNHFENNSTNDILTPTFATIWSTNNFFQHCAAHPATVFINLSGGGVFSSTYDRNDLASGCTLFHAPALGGLVHVYITGSPFPEAAFPEPVLNDSNIETISAGVLRPISFANSATGDYRKALFRGNRDILAITGNTLLHVIGGAVGGATPIGIPPGEKIYFELTNAAGNTVGTSSATTGDFNILGSINPDGLAANVQQTVELTADALGNLVVTNSPGWTVQTTGSAHPVIGSVTTWTPDLQFGGANTGITYSSRFCDSTQIGVMVTITCDFVLTSKGSATGTATIAGVPVAIGPLGGTGGVVAFNANMAGITGAMSASAPNGPTSTIRFFIQSATGSSIVADTNFTNTSQIVFTMTYHD